MNLTPEEYQIVRRVAKYHNGLVVPRNMQIAAIKELQALVNRIDGRGASSDQPEPKEAQSSSGPR